MNENEFFSPNGDDGNDEKRANVSLYLVDDIITLLGGMWRVREE